MTAITTEPAHARDSEHRDRQRSAFRNLVTVEAKLLVREVVPLLWGVGFPMVLLSVMGAFSHGPDKSLGGFSLVASYEPILIAFTCSTFALQGLPAVLAGYRERGILRRLNATPVGAGRLLRRAAHGQPVGDADRDRSASSSSAPPRSACRCRASPPASSSRWS